MKRTVRITWLSVAIGLMGCAPTFAGQLKDPQGEVVTNSEARVNIISLAGAAEEGDAEGPKVIVVEVDQNGGFATSESLPEGEYLIEALVPGYALQSQKVRLGETDLIDLTMTPVGAAKPKATSANMGLDAGRGGGGATLTPPSL